MEMTECNFGKKKFQVFLKIIIEIADEPIILG